MGNVSTGSKQRSLDLLGISEVHMKASETMRKLFRVLLGGTAGFIMGLPVFSYAGPQDHWFYVTKWTNYNGPMGMALGTNGLIFIAEMEAGRVRVINTNGVTLTNWTGVSSPRDVAVSTNGLVYVCDSGNHMVKVFDHAGNFVNSWGGLGTNDGQFDTPTTIGVLRSGNIVVADAGNSRIQIFNPMGVFIRKWGEPGVFDGQFHPPYRDLMIEAEVGSDGLIYVSEPPAQDYPRIQVFDETGVFQRKVYYCYFWSLDFSTSLSAGLQCFFLPRIGMVDIDLYYVLTAVNFYSDAEYLDWIVAGDEVGGGPGISNRHALELPDGTLLVSRYYTPACGSSSSDVLVYKRYYRQRAYNPDMTNDVPIPVIIKAEQRSGTTWMDIDYIVYDGDDTNVSVAALAFLNGGTDLNSVLKLKSFVENTGTNLGENITCGVEHHLTWNVAADVSTNYANLQIEILARDTRDLIDFHFVTIPAHSTNAELTINRSALNPEDFLHVWMWLIATDDPDVELVSGKVTGRTPPYTGLVLASGTTTTVHGLAFLCNRMNVIPVSSAEKELAINARAITGEESTYWVKPKP